MPGAVGLATARGLPDPTMQMGISVWLKMRDKPGFDQALANVTEVSLAGPAATLVEAVSGLDNLGKKSMAQQWLVLRTGKPAAVIPLAAVRGQRTIADFFTADCFGLAQPPLAEPL